MYRIHIDIGTGNADLEEAKGICGYVESSIYDILKDCSTFMGDGSIREQFDLKKIGLKLLDDNERGSPNYLIGLDDPGHITIDL